MEIGDVSNRRTEEDSAHIFRCFEQFLLLNLSLIAVVVAVVVVVVVVLAAAADDDDEGQLVVSLIKGSTSLTT